VSREAEVDCERSPDEEGTKGGDHGAGGEGEGPEDDSGDTEDPEGQACENSLNGGDGEASESGGEDGIADAVKEFVGLFVAKRQECAEGGERERTVAEKEEEQEEHDDELGDEPDRMADEAGEVASDIGCGAAGGVVEVDGAREVLDACRERRMVSDEAADLVLVGSVAEGVYKSECLFAELLGEEICGYDDGEDDEDERDGGAGGLILDFGGEPVVGSPRDDCQYDGSKDG